MAAGDPERIRPVSLGGHSTGRIYPGQPTVAFGCRWGRGSPALSTRFPWARIPLLDRSGRVSSLSLSRDRGGGAGCEREVTTLGATPSSGRPATERCTFKLILPLFRLSPFRRSSFSYPRDHLRLKSTVPSGDGDDPAATVVHLTLGVGQRSASYFSHLCFLLSSCLIQPCTDSCFSRSYSCRPDLHLVAPDSFK